MKTNAELIDVRGDISEYADLIGLSGTLSLGSGECYFAPENSGETLTFIRKRVVSKDGKIRVRTQLGNTFVFETVQKNSAKA